MSDFKLDINPHPLLNSKHVSEAAKNFDAQILVIGVKHIDVHHQIVAESIPDLMAMGYGRSFIEGDADFNNQKEYGKKFVVRDNQGTNKFDLFADFRDQGMSMKFVDYNAEMRKKSGFDSVYNKMVILDRECAKLLKKIPQNLEPLVKQYHLSEQNADDIKTDANIAFFLANQTLENFKQKWKPMMKDNVLNHFGNDITSLRYQYNALNKQRSAFNKFTERRNEHMAIRVATSLKNSEQAILYVGGAHTKGRPDSISPEKTIQALLNNKYNISTLTMELSGGEISILSMSNIWDIIEKSELNEYSFETYGLNSTDIQASANKKTFENFYIDKFDENDLSQPDLAVHISHGRDMKFLKNKSFSMNV